MKPQIKHVCTMSVALTFFTNITGFIVELVNV